MQKIRFLILLALFSLLFGCKTSQSFLEVPNFRAANGNVRDKDGNVVYTYALGFVRDGDGNVVNTYNLGFIRDKDRDIVGTYNLGFIRDQNGNVVGHYKAKDK